MTMLKDPLKSLTVINKCKRLKQWMCQICEDIFSSTQDKLKHCNEEHKGKKVKCNENECSCNKLFKSRKYLRRHLTRGNVFTCKFCKATFSTKQERSEHYRTVHQNYQYPCKQENCGELFKSKVDLFDHTSQEHKYMIKKWWTCGICEEKFAPKPALEKHYKQEHAGKRELCNECSMQFYEKESLESHLNLIHKNVRLKCPDCEYQTSSSRYLKRHKKIKHSENLTKAEKFQCPDCDKIFCERKTLKHHRMSKHEGWRVQCHLCEKWLSSNRSFRQHFNFFHEKRSQSKCVKCDYAGFNMSYHKMKYHKLTYPCIACNFIGESKEEIKFHKKKHEEDCHEIGEQSPECGDVQIHEENIIESQNTEKKDTYEQELQIENKLIIRESQLDLDPVIIGEPSDLVCEELPIFKREIEDQIFEKRPFLIPESLMHEYEEKRKEHQAEMLMKCFTSSQLKE